jgi:hypothetical protein
MATATLYKTDFYAWALAQAVLLREEELAELDLPNLAEELEAIARRERRELTNRLKVLLLHLLKWQFQPDLRSRSWRNTINNQREEMAELLNDSPSLSAEIEAFIASAYPRARAWAQEETGLLSPVFPASCPYSPGEILDPSFFPGP